jgi:DNA modification methylase
MPKNRDPKTPELFTRSVPKMPEGYYSGDKPNPNLSAFVEQHLREKPYDPATDDYDVPAFDKPIESTKATAIYNMHTYWSKKPHDAMRQYIRHYTKSGDLVLDPFCGSGSTALAALMEGRKAIAIDRSPAATFITKNYCTPVDTVALQTAFDELQAKIQPELHWLYETRCDRCGGKATTAYTVYSQVFQCPRCLEKVTLFDCVQVQTETAKGKAKTISVCPICHPKGHSEEISTRSERFGAIPVLVSYFCESGCKPTRDERRHNDVDPKKREAFHNHDIAKCQDIETKPIPQWFPRHRMMNVEAEDVPWGAEWREGRDFRTVAALFTKRNLWALALMADGIRSVSKNRHDIQDSLFFVFSSMCLFVSRMHQDNSGTGGNITKGTYYLPQNFKDMNVWDCFARKARAVFSGCNELLSSQKHTDLCISTQSACHLQQLGDDSVDYIFTDPPYAEKVQYGELNFIWEAWLDFDTKWHNDEIIVNLVRGRSEQDWANMMGRAMQECFRVLRPGRWLSLCYHDTSEGTWSLVQDIMSRTGFVVDSNADALFIDTGQKSQNQLTADKVTKRDLVINFRKPKPGEHRSKVVITGEEDQQTFRQKAQAVVREFLQASPGSTKDRIYDAVVSRLVRKGQMEAHDFDELLWGVADEVKEPVKKTLFENEEPDLLGSHQVGRWHLKESEAGGEEAESATADSAGSRIHDFLAKTTVTKLRESEWKLSELEAEIAQRRTKLQAVDQGKSDESRGKLVREIRELTDKLEKLTAQRAEWERQALDYSQIFEFYVAAVNPKPKATLEEILEDYCYQTDEGNWRPPQTEQEMKEKGSERQRAVRRKIQRFCNLLDAGAAIPEGQRPDAPTLAEWIRHCRRTGLHAQGKLLYERGGDLSALSEQAQVDVEEDYQVCVKALERTQTRVS